MNTHSPVLAFLERMKTDTALQEKLKTTYTAEDVARVAQESGYAVTADDLNQHRFGGQDELSDQEVEAVAGGRQPTCNNSACVNTRTCWEFTCCRPTVSW